MMKFLPFSPQNVSCLTQIVLWDITVIATTVKSKRSICVILTHLGLVSVKGAISKDKLLFSDQNSWKKWLRYLRMKLDLACNRACVNAGDEFLTQRVLITDSVIALESVFKEIFKWQRGVKLTRTILNNSFFFKFHFSVFQGLAGRFLRVQEYDMAWPVNRTSSISDVALRNITVSPVM